MMPVSFVILVLYLPVLFFVSQYDYYHMRVKLNEGMLLVVLGVVYMIVTGGYLQTFVCLCLLLMVFGLPCLFDFGLGDLLVFISLAPFLAMGNVYWFLGVFFMIWLVWGVVMINKNVIEGRFQRFWDAFSRKAVFTLEYPLVPVILVAFIVWLSLCLLFS